jgi:hypothetical protein
MLKYFPRIAFSTWQFSISLYCIFHIVFKLNIKFEAKYDIYTIKTQIVLHQSLHYSQIFNFILNHDYKFKTIIV